MELEETEQRDNTKSRAAQASDNDVPGTNRRAFGHAPLASSRSSSCSTICRTRLMASAPLSRRVRARYIFQFTSGDENGTAMSCPVSTA